MFRVKVSAKGRVVIPKTIRKSYHLNEGTEILFVPVEEGVLIKLVEKALGLRGLLTELKVDPLECEAILAEAKRSLTKVVE
ncbi:MAG: SpoVT / AbrB like domain protein [Candidatus Bathyarchaeota archaeon BA1]|nr:MAG: SpoVT / AbrB like domain protein [Candidatus Bathyarchaeota archaeon BA1]